MKLPFVRLAFLAAAASMPLMSQNRACQLLTPEEVRSGTGVAFGTPEAVTMPAGDVVCGFSTAKGIHFSIAIRERAGRLIFETNKTKVSKRSPVIKVSGLGDDAFVVARGGFSDLSVLKGDTVIALGLIGQPDGAPKLEDLARKALARL